MKHLINPNEIETLSLQIIAAQTGIELNSPEGLIAGRVIHATGDPALVCDLIIHPEAVMAGKKALSNRGHIITDVNMVKTGISQVLSERFGVSILCHIDHPSVINAAKTLGHTRAKVAIEMLSPWMDGGIVAIGNAPTALFHLIELIRQKKVKPELIVGTPVGFVGAAESKELLTSTQTPHITIRGTKGGSAVAAAIVNTLFRIMLQEEEKHYG